MRAVARSSAGEGAAFGSKRFAVHAEYGQHCARLLKGCMLSAYGARATSLHVHAGQHAVALSNAGCDGHFMSQTCSYGKDTRQFKNAKICVYLQVTVQDNLYGDHVQ